MHRNVLLAALLLILACCLVVGCGGGGSGDISGGRGAAVFTVQWPPLPAGDVTPALVPQATRSITVTLMQGDIPVAPPQTVVREAGGPTTATITFNNLAAGPYTATATAYPNQDGTGTPVASASVPVQVQSGGASQVNLVLDSTIVSIVVSPASATVGVQRTYQLLATARDAEGSVVLISPSMVQWASSAPGAATVSTTGLVTGVDPGNTQVTFTETESGQSATADISVLNTGVTGKVIDLQTQQPIVGASIEVRSLGGTLLATATTNSAGRFDCAVAPGTYNMVALATGHDNNTAQNVVIGAIGSRGSLVWVLFALPQTGSSPQYGTVCGRVSDSSGAPVPNATVTIDGGAQTNGVFASDVTAGDGTYAIFGISVRDTGGNPIASFKVRASKPSFVPAVQNVVVLANQTVANVDFSLTPAGGGGGSVFSDDFETNTAWTATGFWHRQPNAVIRNQAVPDYVTLPPGDASDGRIPDAFSGSHCWWYGDPATGNYLGTQASGDTPLSGGRSTQSNAGTLTSPPISLSGVTNPELTFMAWYEIESQNPNSTGYDLMIVKASTDDGSTFIELMRLNPYADPTVANRAPLAYTSGGFNQPANWIPVTVDLSAFVGESVRLQFEFDTRDPNFNGFRGWFIDSVSVQEPLSVTSAGRRLPQVRDLRRGWPPR